MPRDMHTAAAEHHETAAKLHREAAEQHSNSDHEMAHDQSSKACAEPVGA
jgi:hypothetical protein